MKIELQAAKDLALRAGAILLKHYAEGFSVEWKGKNDPVTDADRASSRVLVEELHKRFPNDAILSEEEKDDLRGCAETGTDIVSELERLAAWW